MSRADKQLTKTQKMSLLAIECELVVSRPSSAAMAEYGFMGAHWRYGSISGRTLEVLHSLGLVERSVRANQQFWDITANGAKECQEIRQARAFLFEAIQEQESE